jgi:SAM-dependent methyltransferase
LVPKNPYDSVRYPAWPRIETHPDRLAAIATLYGMKPAAVDHCRVLEIGCSDGGNLIPMAYELPGSHFTGVDLAAAPVRVAKAAVRELALKNVRLLRADVCALPKTLGEFDYILVHGLYSWVPAKVRDALLAACAAHLAPAGVALVSYVVYPGRHVREMLREMLLYRTAGRPDVETAREFLRFLKRGAMVSDAWRPLLNDEVDSMLSRDDAGLFHDDLAAENHPVYFHQFVEHAAGHRLQYLGEAHVHEMTNPQGALASLGRNRIEREQYLDFLKLRRFRQTLLCRAGVRLRRKPDLRAIERLWFSSPAEVADDLLVGSNRVRIRAGDPAVNKIAHVLRAAWPRPVSFAELREADGNARDVLHTLLLAGFVEPHAWHFPAPREVGERPRASAVARWELGRGTMVTNLCHRSVEVDATLHAMLPLLDGTRDRKALGRAVGRKAKDALEWMARMALLVE